VSESPSQDWQDQLQASLRRAQDAIARGVAQQDQTVGAWTQGLRSAYPDWGRERWQRRLERKLRKRAEREARIASATLVEGYLWLLGAMVLLIAALSLAPFGLFLLFPAVNLGVRGSRVISRHMGITHPAVAAAGMRGAAGVTQAAAAQASAQEQQARERAARFGSMDLGPLARPRGVAGTAVETTRSGAGAQAQWPDSRDQRVDAICDKILAELRSSPEMVKEIFRKPEETVSALRATCRDLTRREREVRRFLVPEEDVRLERERAALAARVGAESDEVTRLRLASALAALDQQRQQRTDLGRSAARFDAEHTRISYTLESLYTQVVRMRSADAGSVDVAGAGLRRSLDLLSQEVNALADALEKVNEGADRGPAARLKALAEGPGAPPDGVGPPAPSAREKA
jgi:hypothetical protein